jgi:hypothetical protein
MTLINNIQTNVKNNIINEMDVSNFVKFLFYNFPNFDGSEIKDKKLSFYWDLRLVGSKPDLLVSTDGLIKIFVEEKDLIPMLDKHKNLKLEELKYQTLGEAIACAQNNLVICNAKNLDFNQFNKIYGINVIGTLFLFSQYVISQQYLLSISGIRDDLQKYKLQVKEFHFENFNQTLDYCNPNHRLLILKIMNAIFPQ